jgi:hypothetical protein
MNVYMADSDHELRTFLAAAGLEALEQTLRDEELSLGVLRYMALQDSFSADLADLGVGERDCRALQRALTESPARQQAVGRASGSAGASGAVGSCSCSVVDAALAAVATTDVVSGVGSDTPDRTNPVPAATGWSATQINHVGAAVAPPPKPKSGALLAYLRREGKGHYADPGKVAGGGFNLDTGTIDPNRTWRPEE